MLAGECIDLSEGDAIQFDSARPHYMINNDDQPQTALIVSTAGAVTNTAPAPAQRR